MDQVVDDVGILDAEAPGDDDAVEQADVNWPRAVRDSVMGLAVCAVLLGLPFLAIKELKGSDANTVRDVAVGVTSILGVVVPAVATIGAAIFGVSVAYRASRKERKAADERVKAAEERRRSQGALHHDREQHLRRERRHDRELLRELNERLVTPLAERRPEVVPTSRLSSAERAAAAERVNAMLDESIPYEGFMAIDGNFLGVTEDPAEAARVVVLDPGEGRTEDLRDLKARIEARLEDGVA